MSPISFWSAVICLMLIGCESNISESKPFSREISMYSLLMTHQTQQRVYVYYTTDRIFENINATELFVQNANVTLRSNNGEVAFQNQQEGRNPVFMNTPNTLPILSEKTYQLTVESDAGVIRGSTTVPGAFQIIQPTPNQTITPDSLPLRWIAGKNAAGYIINIIQPEVQLPITPDSVLVYRPIRTFSTVETHYTVSKYFVMEPGEYTLQILAYDENFRKHEIEGYDASGITGGYGMFASAAVDTLHFFVSE